MNRILGVDPGATGGWALIGPDGTIAEAFPVIRHRKLAFIDGHALLTHLAACGVSTEAESVAYVEDVHAMPKQGVSSTFSFGAAHGGVLAILRAAGCRIEFVQPARWKGWAGLVRREDETISAFKRRSLDRARLMFPNMRLDRAKDSGIAEALLIAAYGQAQHAIPARAMPAEAA